MPQLSIKKIMQFIVLVIVLMHLKTLLQGVKRALSWFTQSLSGLNNFPEGGQTAIAFLSILLVVFMIFKLLHRSSKSDERR
jgi:type II secretory pathway component PulF